MEVASFSWTLDDESHGQLEIFLETVLDTLVNRLRLHHGAFKLWLLRSSLWGQLEHLITDFDTPASEIEHHHRVNDIDDNSLFDI